jgi:hypothetical protein
MSTFTVKRGDTAPQFRACCLDDATPVNLSAATGVRFLMRKSGSSTGIAATMIVENQTTATGWVHRAWGTTDLATAGDYRAEVEVTWSDSTVQTFPADGWVDITVEEDLG